MSGNNCASTSNESDVDANKCESALNNKDEDMITDISLRPDIASSKSTSEKERLLFYITVSQARLNKNYGFLPMSLYCQLLVGNAWFETQTVSSSGKHPVWNESFQCWLEENIEKVSIKIISENLMFSNSEVAHADIILPRSLFGGVAINQWYGLSGKQGENAEGSVHLIFQCARVTRQMPNIQTSPNVFLSSPGSFIKPITAEDVRSIREIFPNVDDDTIKSILSTHHGNRDQAVSELLRMSDET